MILVEDKESSQNALEYSAEDGRVEILEDIGIKVNLEQAGLYPCLNQEHNNNHLELKDEETILLPRLELEHQCASLHPNFRDKNVDVGSSSTP